MILQVRKEKILRREKRRKKLHSLMDKGDARKDVPFT